MFLWSHQFTAMASDNCSRRVKILAWVSFESCAPNKALYTRPRGGARPAFYYTRRFETWSNQIAPKRLLRNYCYWHSYSIEIDPRWHDHRSLLWGRPVSPPPMTSIKPRSRHTTKCQYNLVLSVNRKRREYEILKRRCTVTSRSINFGCENVGYCTVNPEHVRTFSRLNPHPTHLGAIIPLTTRLSLTSSFSAHTQHHLHQHHHHQLSYMEVSIYGHLYRTFNIGPQKGAFTMHINHNSTHPSSFGSLVVGPLQHDVINIVGHGGFNVGRFVAFRPKVHGFESRSSRHVGTLGKSSTCSCLWRFGMKLRHSIRAVLGAPLSSSGLEEALY